MISDVPLLKRKKGLDKKATNEFVYGGRKSLLVLSRKNVAQIRKAINDKYAVEIANAHFFRRVLLEISIRREIKQEIQKLAPPNALYIKTGKQ